MADSQRSDTRFTTCHVLSNVERLTNGELARLPLKRQLEHYFARKGPLVLIERQTRLSLKHIVILEVLQAST